MARAREISRGMGRKDATALEKEAELLFVCQESNKQKAGWIEEVWGGGSYFLDPDRFLGSFQKEEKKSMRASLSRKSPLRASGPILETSKVRPRNTR